MRYLALSLLLVFPLFLSAQKEVVRREIGEINRAYAKLTVLRSEIEYVMYASHAAGAREIDRQRAIVSRKGDAYHFKMGEIETLITSQYNIAADHEDQTLTIDKIRNHAERSEKQFGLDLETALDACDTFWLSEPTAGSRKITLEIFLPDLERAELWFDARTHLMQKVVLFYREAEEWEEGAPASKARMEMLYRRQDDSPALPKDLFSVERFVRKTGKAGGFAPAPRFQSYAFINQTHVQ